MAKKIKVIKKSIKNKKKPSMKSIIKVYSSSSFYSNMNGKKKSIRIQKKYNSTKDKIC